MPTLSAREAARYCGVSDITMRRWIQNGAIPAKRSATDARAFEVDQAALDASGKVRHPGATIDGIPITHLANGATPPEIALMSQAMSQAANVLEILEHLRERESAADARAAKADAEREHWANEAARWAFEAGTWKARAEQLQQTVTQLQLPPPVQRPWWKRWLGL